MNRLFVNGVGLQFDDIEKVADAFKTGITPKEGADNEVAERQTELCVKILKKFNSALIDDTFAEDLRAEGYQDDEIMMCTDVVDEFFNKCAFNHSGEYMAPTKDGSIMGTYTILNPTQQVSQMMTTDYDTILGHYHEYLMGSDSLDLLKTMIKPDAYKSMIRVVVYASINGVEIAGRDPATAMVQKSFNEFAETITFKEDLTYTLGEEQFYGGEYSVESLTMQDVIDKYEAFSGFLAQEYRTEAALIH